MATIVAHVVFAVAIAATAALLVWFVTRAFLMMDDIRYLCDLQMSGEEQRHEGEEGEGDDEQYEVYYRRTPVFPFLMVAAILMCAALIMMLFIE